MISKQRVILDTNLLISYLIKADSLPGKVVDDVLRHHWILYSEATLLELTNKMTSEKLRRYFSAAEGIQMILLLEQVAEYVDVKSEVNDCRDPKDNAFLALAIDGEADLLITGDQDLLILHPYQNIPIVRPADYIFSPANH